MSTTAAPPQGKTRPTRVDRLPFYVPWDNDGKGGWRFLPIGSTHRHKLEETDGEGNVIGEYPLYEAKGFVPVIRVPEDDPRRASLPTNWRDLLNAPAVGMVKPVYATQVASEPVSEPAEAEPYWPEPEPQAAFKCSCGKESPTMAGLRAHQRAKERHKPAEVHEDA